MIVTKTFAIRVACVSALALIGTASRTFADTPATWEPAGWGGGGFYYAAAFHPSQDGVIYLAGDVGGVYKTIDHGKSWRIINNGLAEYGVFTLAVDQMHPDTVYAANGNGLSKSTDAGEHWQLLPQTGPKQLHITGEKGRSIRCVAVDPTNSNLVYAASPIGKVYKSADGGQTWKSVFQPTIGQDAPDLLRVQFGKVTGDYYGGIWVPLKAPSDIKPTDLTGFGFTFQGDGTLPQTAIVTLTTSPGTAYRSQNLNTLFQDKSRRDVVLKGSDFSLDPDYAKKNPDIAKTLPTTPDWATVNRVDVSCSGPLPTQANIGRFGRFFFEAGSAAKPTLVTVRDFSDDKSVRSYGSISAGSPKSGSIYSVAVSPKNPSTVIAATNDVGLVLSRDAGQTWAELNAPKKASSVAFAATDPNVVYASFFTDGIWKSADAGKTWNSASGSIGKDFSVREVTVSPTNPLDVYAVGSVGWNGIVYLSHDGAKTWVKAPGFTADSAWDPTLPQEAGKSAWSAPTNVTVNPKNPKEIYISANWRSAWSGDGGLTWSERDRGADISCVTDIRFNGNRTYVTVMDEGTLMSEDNGKTWTQLWPLKWTADVSGHNWRVAVNTVNGVPHVISTVSPWDGAYTPRIVRSDDGGKTTKVITAGLPDYIVHPNTMWGQGYPRALAVDPNNPQIVYMGIDGDPEAGKSGGGVFKSQDGGATWTQLPNQPRSRRMYYGLAVDPTDSQRVFWGAAGTGGGVYRSEDGGGNWKSVFTNENFVWNVLITKQGDIYASGQNLWRSTDHGTTWKQLTKFTDGRSIVGLEADPRDSKTFWFTQTTWDGSPTGGVFKTTDYGVTWDNITGNLPYRKPQVIRFNPATNELWVGFVGLHKIKQ